MSDFEITEAKFEKNVASPITKKLPVVPSSQSGENWVGMLSKRAHEKKVISHKLVKIDDEYLSPPPLKLDVQQPIVFDVEDSKGNKSQVDLTADIQKEFDYLAATKGLEIGTERVNLLQNYVDTMVDDDPKWKGKARVIIMNKGMEPTAFAYPDGSIFISQSLINLYDSLDEVVAVTAHEVKHFTNGTSEAATKAQYKRGAKLGVDWLHEMLSDFGSAELLEKVRLKTTATSDVLTRLGKHFGNRRGTKHQAPVMRAIEHLGLHAIKDYETSHIDYTPLSQEFKRESIKTNLEYVAEAVENNNIEAVNSYLTKLHQRDLDTVFETVDFGSWHQFTDARIPKTTEDAVRRSVQKLVEQRLQNHNYSPEQIKLFFLSKARGYSDLTPTFENISELTDLVSVAQQMYQNETYKAMHQSIFGREKSKDQLSDIVEHVHYRMDKLAGDKKTPYIDMDDITDFIGKVDQQVKSSLPVIKSDSFVDDKGDWLRSGINRSADIHLNAESILFTYIEKFYLPNVSDGELDQDQMTLLFTKAKEAGFEPVTASYFFPIPNDKIGDGDKQIIENSFRNVFGRELIKRDTPKGAESLPPLLEFSNLLATKDPRKIEDYLVESFRNKELPPNERAEYIDLALKHIRTVDLNQQHREKYAYDKIGYIAMRDWREHGEPKLRYNQTPRQLTFDQLIDEYGLNRQEMETFAIEKAEIERTDIQIKLISGTIADSQNHVLQFAEDIMQTSKIDIKTANQYQLLATCKPLFELANRDDSSFIYRDERITDFERFYHLPFVQEIVTKVEAVHFDSLEQLESYTSEAKKKYLEYPVNANFSLFEDDVYSVILAKPVRSEFMRLVDTGITKDQYPTLIKILNSHVPYSPQRRDLIRSMQQSYLKDDQIPLQNKMDMFFKEYELFGVEGAVLVAEQITDVATYRQFREKLGDLGQEYITGKKDVTGVAAADIVSTLLTQKADLLIKTVSDDPKTSAQVSTDMAVQWLRTYMTEDSWRSKEVRYDDATNKFVLTSSGRSAFISFEDTVDYLKGLDDGKKLSIALKALSDQDGLLITERGRSTLEHMLKEGLDITEPFLRAVIEQGTSGDAKIIGLPASQMLVPFLFRALDTQAIDYQQIRGTEISERVKGETVYTKVRNKGYSPHLEQIFNSSTRDLRYFGFRYQSQPNSVLAQQAQESSETYFGIMENLQNQIIAPQNIETTSSTEKAILDPSTEAIIKAGETSPIFVRGMQMAVQLIDFDPALQRRLAETQDSMKGLEKLRFWDNLLTKATFDPELQRFINEDLISLDSYLGGGSLFTTYGATVKDSSGESRNVVIKMLNPNAEEFIHLSYGFSTDVLQRIEEKYGRKPRERAKLAGTLLDLANNWCIKDINDGSYIERDDAFKSTVTRYNKQRGSEVMRAPERGYTSKKVKVEDRYEGTTVNKMLNNPDVAPERKKAIVQELVNFFDFQFETPSTVNNEGADVFIFHSDPHTGNYLTEMDQEGVNLGVIDRSMYLALGRNDVEILKRLKDRDYIGFLSSFVESSLNKNHIIGFQRNKIKFTIFGDIGAERLAQAISHHPNPMNYLQKVMNTFAQESVDVPIEMRLMIRNVVAMDNLRKKWLQS